MPKKYIKKLKKYIEVDPQIIRWRKKREKLAAKEAAKNEPVDVRSELRDYFSK